ncbi:MAG: hypothetical protein ACI8V5_002059, partial [Limisphaerales bacterium]
PIQIRSLNLAPIAANIRKPHIIRKEDNNVRFGAGRRRKGRKAVQPQKTQKVQKEIPSHKRRGIYARSSSHAIPEFNQKPAPAKGSQIPKEAKIPVRQESLKPKSKPLRRRDNIFPP